jgi:hypothetical protein
VGVCGCVYTHKSPTHTHIYNLFQLQIDCLIFIFMYAHTHLHGIHPPLPIRSDAVPQHVHPPDGPLPTGHHAAHAVAPNVGHLWFGVCWGVWWGVGGLVCWAVVVFVWLGCGGGVGGWCVAAACTHVRLIQIA